MRFRTLAGLAAGALTAGVLAVPGIASADEPASSVTIDFTCPYSSWEIAFSPTIEASYDGDDIALEIGSFPAIAGPPAFVTVSRAAADLTAEVAGEETVFSGAQDITPAVPLSGGFDLPTLTAPVPAGYAGGEVSVTGLTVTMTAMNSATPITCSMDEPVSFDMPAPPVPPLFSCSYNAWTLPFDSEMEMAQDGTSVSLTMGSNFPGIAGVPAFVTVSKVAATATGTVGGHTVALSGENLIEPATPLAAGFSVPTLTGTLPTGLPAGSLTLTSLDVTLTAMGSDNEIPCVMSREVAFDVASTEVPVAAKAKPKMQKVKAKFAKKKKVLTVKGQVKGSNGKATGKVKITVKKGKKTVKNVTVKLNKKGAFTKKIKKIKGKGKFKVVIQYQGDKNYKKAKATKQFRA